MGEEKADDGGEVEGGMKLVMGASVLYAERLRVRANEVEERISDVNIALMKSHPVARTAYMKGLRKFRRTIGGAHGLRPDEVAVPAVDGG